MVEGEPPGVEHQPAGAGFLALGLGVDRIADQRAAEVQQMHADLVGAARVEVAEDQRTAG